MMKKNALLVHLALLLSFVAVSQDHFGSRIRSIDFRFFKPFAPDISMPCMQNQRLGGRVIALSIKESDNNQIMCSHQFGGIWKTDNNGGTWEWCSGIPEVLTNDVQYGRNSKVFATVAQNLKVQNGGGIYRSLDNGNNWQHLPNATPRVAAMVRISAYGISLAPGKTDTIYVGTDRGVSISYDGGTNWFFRVAASNLNDSVRVTNILAVTPDTVIAGTDRGAFISYNAGDTWTQVNNQAYTYSFNRIDNHPLMKELVFLISDPGELICYNIRTRSSTTIQHPALVSRWPFIRVSSSPNAPTEIVLWLSVGVVAFKTTVSNPSQFGSINNSSSWQNINEIDRTVTLHADMGDLAFNNAKNAPLYAGSDGGIFKASNPQGTRWQPGSTVLSGMNSLQITSLSGTQIPTGDARAPYSYDLYFTTQDNNNHSSANDGLNWTTCDCTEGHSVRASQTVARASDARVSYYNISCFAGPKLSQRNYASSRVFSVTNDSPDPVQNFWIVTPVSTNSYLRYGQLASGRQGFFVSENADASSWRLIGTAAGLIPMGHLARLSRDNASTIAYYPMAGSFNANPCAAGVPIGLLKINSIFARGVVSYSQNELLLLPNNGSLGQVATEFDWHAVYGVHPEDGNYIIAPDICNNRVMITRNGGTRWEIDQQLTNLVTQNGTYLLYVSQYLMQITCIAYDPYDNNHIMIGTRDFGLIESIDRGQNWYSVSNTSQIKYITDIFYRHDNTMVISTYGHGLWQSDFERIYFPTDFKALCLNGVNCGRIVDPRRWRDELVLPEEVWYKNHGFLVYGGYLLNNRAVRKGSTTLKISKNSDLKFYNLSIEEQKKYTVIYKSEKSFFQVLKRFFRGNWSAIGFAQDEQSQPKMVISKKHIYLENEYNEEKPVQNMLLANYDFSPEQKIVLKDSYQVVEAIPYLSICDSCAKLENGERILRVQFYNFKLSLEDIEAFELNGFRFKQPKGQIEFDAKENCFVGTFYLPESLDLDVSQFYGIDFYFKNKLKLNTYFRFGKTE